MSETKQPPSWPALAADEFEDVDLRMEPTAGPGVQPSLPEAPPTETLASAHEQLERRLLLETTEEAASASSGTTGLGFENIVGVGLANKRVAGQETPLPAVTVYVVEKAPSDEIDPRARVPREVHGVPTDVVATGELVALAARGRFRPAPAGVSVSHFLGSAGTLGCLVRRENALFILSNNHILANLNRGTVGDLILQPGPADGGRPPDDAIARLAEYVPLQFDGAPNSADCAIAQTSPEFVTRYFCFGPLDTEPIPCSINMLVKKCGRLTGFTIGRITDCSASLRVRYENRMALFRGQMVIQSVSYAPFSAPGDSGSLIVSNDFNRPVGLLFGGSATHTLASPIEKCLSALNVAIL